MNSIKDVARLAGVSIATVSRYLNNPEQVRDKTARKVAQAIADTGYSPNRLAQNFRNGRTKQIMVAVPSIGIPFFELIMRGVRRVAAETGYHILVMETHSHTHDFDDFSRLVMTKQTDGIILLSTLSPFEEPILDTEGGHPPIILGLENLSPELSNFPCVRIDNRLAAREATELLIHLGHRDIAFMYGKQTANSALTQPREQGFRDALDAAGLRFRAEWFIDGKLTIRGGRDATRQLLAAKTRPTALFCANDEMAMGALHELKQAGLSIPRDISVIGFDDMQFSEVADPPLTTVAQPAEEIGERSMKRLLAIIDGNAPAKGADVIPHRLVMRKSAAPPAQKP